MSEDMAFDDLGTPGRADVKAVWDSMPEPSIRKVHALMTQRGWKTSISTIQRWAQAGFVEPPEGKRPKKTTATVKKIGDKVRRDGPKEAIAKLAETAAIKGCMPQVKQALEEAFSPSTVAALVDLPKEDLKDKLDRLTMAASIVALEAFVHKVNALVLLPKDTGSFLSSMADVANAMRPVGGKVPGNGKTRDDSEQPMRAIDGEVVEDAPASPLSQKISQFRKEHGLAVVVS